MANERVLGLDNVWQWDIDKFLNEAASSAPTPGGGSVSAYVGALASSMVSMVANLTVGKEKYRNVEPEVIEILHSAQTLLEALKSGVTDDIAVFKRFMEVLRLPKETTEQKAFRAEQLQAVLKEACESPLQVARNSLEVLKLAEKLAPIGNQGAISDVGVAGYLAESALRSALLSVAINLPQLKDEEYVQRIETECREMTEYAARLRIETLEIVQKRFGE